KYHLGSILPSMQKDCNLYTAVARLAQSEAPEEGLNKCKVVSSFEEGLAFIVEHFKEHGFELTVLKSLTCAYFEHENGEVKVFAKGPHSNELSPNTTLKTSPGFLGEFDVT